MVITRDAGYEAPGATVVHSLDEALDAVGDAAEIMIVGGGRSSKRELLPVADRLYLTLVETTEAGDVYFLQIEPGEWVESFGQGHLQMIAIRMPLPGKLLIVTGPRQQAK
ncbi:MAG: dihydrofolate reductase [Chloroflexota bacterium]